MLRRSTLFRYDPEQSYRYGVLPEENAFYYARVLEIPTPPWYAYDAFRFGVEIPEGAPESQQERAYTSPIWYTP